MKIELRRALTLSRRQTTRSIDRKLASYVAASASIGIAASEAKAIVISNPTVQNVGINGIANIDFNSDGQIDFQIDHDRIDLTPQGGPVVDYLQLDKNDINGEGNPLDFDPLVNLQAATFPPGNTTPNDANNSAFLIQDPPNNGQFIQYPSALIQGAEIGPSSNYDMQEGDNVYASGKTGRMNRLIDEDHGQVDMLLGGKTADQIVTPSNAPQFLGVVGEVRYLGVRMDLNNSSANNVPAEYNFGWIGIKVINEADATAQVVGYGYETQPGTSILAGTTGGRAGDFNNDGKVNAADYVLWRKGAPLQNETVTLGSATPEDYVAWRLNFDGSATAGAGIGTGRAVPEPSSLLASLIGGLGLVCVYFFRRIRRK